MTQAVRNGAIIVAGLLVAACVQLGDIQRTKPVRTLQFTGLTHYAITVGRTGPDKGFAEWRIMTPARQAGPGTSARPLTNAMVQQYWTPVQECAARAKGSWFQDPFTIFS